MIAKTWNVNFETQRKGQRVISTEKKSPALPAGRIPRISRLMALAHHLEELVVSGQVKDYAELARLGHVSRARIGESYVPLSIERAGTPARRASRRGDNGFSSPETDT